MEIHRNFCKGNINNSEELLIKKPELKSPKNSLTNNPSVGFFPLRRIQTKAATYIGITSPDCAAPSGFLNLLTL